MILLTILIGVILVITTLKVLSDTRIILVMMAFLILPLLFNGIINICNHISWPFIAALVLTR